MAGEHRREQGDAPQGGPGAATRAASKFIIFDNFAKMNTQNPRQTLDAKELAWLENLQPIGKNNLAAVPAALAALATITGQTVKTFYYADLPNGDYVIAFTVAGAGYAINASSGVVTNFAPNGTFSAPDMTTWESQRILIQDPTAGYSTWDGNVFVKQGSVSPNLIVTAGGSGYVAPPAVTITGGSGSGAAASAVISGGSVVALMLTNPGIGYKSGDVLTVVFAGGGGSGATATAIVWPFVNKGTTIAVFQGRVWAALGRVITYSGTAGYDDFNPANAAGTSTIADADLVHSITALRNLNNYLFIFGDGSIKQIGNITVSGSATNFAILTLSSDLGTTFKNSIQSYNRLVVFANKVGVYAIFGASVQKVSDDLDGIFQLVDFTQEPVAGLNDIRNLHCYLLLVKYNDPALGPRSIMCAFTNNKWFVISQGNGLLALCTVSLGATAQSETFASSGADVTQLLQDSTTAVAVTARTALTHHGNLVQQKKVIRGGVAATVLGPVSMNVTLDSENGSVPYTLPFVVPMSWVNNSGQVVAFVNNSSQVVELGASGFQFPSKMMDGSGKFLGMTITGTVANYSLNAVAIEYQETVLWGKP